MCNKNIPIKRVYKTAMMYGAECWAVRKKEQMKLHTTEMRMLQWAQKCLYTIRITTITVQNQQFGASPTYILPYKQYKGLFGFRIYFNIGFSVYICEMGNIIPEKLHGQG